MTSTADWIAVVSLIATLSAIAWAAVRYVGIERRKVAQTDFDNFYRTLERVHNKDQSLLLQAAAIFELRNFPRYAEFVIRLCNNNSRYFPSAPDVLANEFNSTRRYLLGEKND